MNAAVFLLLNQVQMNGHRINMEAMKRSHGMYTGDYPVLHAMGITVTESEPKPKKVFTAIVPERSTETLKQVEKIKAAAFESALKHDTQDHWLNRIFRL